MGLGLVAQRRQPRELQVGGVDGWSLSASEATYFLLCMSAFIFLADATLHLFLPDFYSQLSSAADKPVSAEKISVSNAFLSNHTPFTIHAPSFLAPLGGTAFIFCCSNRSFSCQHPWASWIALPLAYSKGMFAKVGTNLINN